MLQAISEVTSMNQPMNKAAPTILCAIASPALSNNGLLLSFAPHIIVGVGHGLYCGFVGS